VQFRFNNANGQTMGKDLKRCCPAPVEWHPSKLKMMMMMTMMMKCS